MVSLRCFRWTCIDIAILRNNNLNYVVRKRWRWREPQPSGVPRYGSSGSTFMLRSLRPWNWCLNAILLGACLRTVVDGTEYAETDGGVEWCLKALLDKRGGDSLSEKLLAVIRSHRKSHTAERILTETAGQASVICGNRWLEHWLWSVQESKNLPWQSNAMLASWLSLAVCPAGEARRAVLGRKKVCDEGAILQRTFHYLKASIRKSPTKIRTKRHTRAMGPVTDLTYVDAQLLLQVSSWAWIRSIDTDRQLNSRTASCFKKEQQTRHLQVFDIFYTLQALTSLDLYRLPSSSASLV